MNIYYSIIEASLVMLYVVLANLYFNIQEDCNYSIPIWFMETNEYNWMISYKVLLNAVIWINGHDFILCFTHHKSLSLILPLPNTGQNRHLTPTTGRHIIHVHANSEVCITELKWTFLLLNIPTLPLGEEIVYVSECYSCHLLLKDRESA